MIAVAEQVPDALAAKIFKTPAAGLAGLAAQARTFLIGEDECELEFSRIGAVLAAGIARLAA